MLFVNFLTMVNQPYQSRHYQQKGGVNQAGGNLQDIVMRILVIKFPTITIRLTVIFSRPILQKSSLF